MPKLKKPDESQPKSVFVEKNLNYGTETTIFDEKTLKESKKRKKKGEDQVQYCGNYAGH